MSIYKTLYETEDDYLDEQDCPIQLIVFAALWPVALLLFICFLGG